MRGWRCTSFDRLSYQASTGWLRQAQPPMFDKLSHLCSTSSATFVRQAQPPMFDELSHLASITSACLVLKSVYKNGCSIIFFHFLCDTAGVDFFETQKKPESKTPVFNFGNFMCYHILMKITSDWLIESQ